MDEEEEHCENENNLKKSQASYHNEKRSEAYLQGGPGLYFLSPP